MVAIPIGRAPGVLAPHLDAHASIQEAARLMAASQRDCVLLLQQGHVTGVFSDQELLHAMGPDGSLSSSPAGQWLAPGTHGGEEADAEGQSRQIDRRRETSANDFLGRVARGQFVEAVDEGRGGADSDPAHQCDQDRHSTGKADL